MAEDDKKHTPESVAARVARALLKAPVGKKRRSHPKPKIGQQPKTRKPKPA